MQWQGQQEEAAKQQAAETAKAKAEEEQQEEAAKQQAAEKAKAKAEAEAKRMQKEAAKQQSAAEVKRKKEEKRKREEPLDLLRSIHEEVVGTDPQHGGSYGHYKAAPKLRFSLGNQ